MGAKTAQRFPNGVRAFVRDMLSLDTGGSIRAVEPMYDIYYHHKRSVVDRANALASRLDGSDDGKNLKLAIRIYEESVVKRIHDHLPAPPDVIWKPGLLVKDEPRRN